MRIVCRKCKTSFEIPEDRLPAHGSTVPCKSCGTPFAFFVVDSSFASQAQARPSHLPEQFSHTSYTIKRQIFKIFGGAFRIYDSLGNLVFYSRQKAFKLKEDIRVFTDESMAEELLTIKARQVLDIAAAYDVEDPRTREKVGALRRKGLKSIIRDEWIILDPDDREVGTIKEDSALLAVIRRFLTNLIPQSYTGEVNTRTVFEFKQNFNPFTLNISLDFSPDRDGILDRRLGIAAAVLLTAVEGRQKG